MVISKKLWMVILAGTILAHTAPHGFAGANSQSGQATLHCRRADALLARGKLIAAIENYTLGIELNDRMAGAFVNRGYAYQLNGDMGRAKADFDRAIRIDPRLAQAYVNRGNLFQIQGNLDAAIADYDRAIKIDRKLVDAYYNRGGARFIKRDFEGAIDDLERVINKAPKFRADSLVLQVTDPILSRSYTIRGEAWKRLGELTQAMADFSAAIELDPSSANAFLQRGVVQASLGNFEAALRDFDAALQICPSMWEAHFNLGYTELKLDRPQAGLASFHRVIELHPFATAYGWRAIARVLTGDLPGAMGDFDYALELDPEVAVTDPFLSKSARAALPSQK